MNVIIIIIKKYNKKRDLKIDQFYLYIIMVDSDEENLIDTNINSTINDDNDEFDDNEQNLISITGVTGGVDNDPDEDDDDIPAVDDENDDDDDDNYDLSEEYDIENNQINKEYINFDNNYNSEFYNNNQYDYYKICSNEIIFTKPQKKFKYLTKYEKTRIYGIRKHQLSHGYPPLIDNDTTDLSYDDIITLEFKKKLLPFIIIRSFGHNNILYFRLEDLELFE